MSRVARFLSWSCVAALLGAGGAVAATVTDQIAPSSDPVVARSAALNNQKVTYTPAGPGAVLRPRSRQWLVAGTEVRRSLGPEKLCHDVQGVSIAGSTGGGATCASSNLQLTTRAEAHVQIDRVGNAVSLATVGTSVEVTRQPSQGQPPRVRKTFPYAQVKNKSSELGGVIYKGLAGSEIRATYTLLAGLGFESIANKGRIEIGGGAGSDLPGLQRLFGWNAQVSGRPTRGVSVSFRSNPLLGLDDSAIERAIKAAFVYDPVKRGWVVAEDLNYLDVVLQVPTEATKVRLRWGTGAEATIPLPASALLSLTALAAMGVLGRRRRSA